MQQGDNMMETADMTMNGCSLSGPGGAMENSTTHKNIRSTGCLLTRPDTASTVDIFAGKDNI